MRDSLTLALVRAERCRAASARWAAPTDREAADIIAASELLLRMAERARRAMRRLIARRRTALHTVPPH